MLLKTRLTAALRCLALWKWEWPVCPRTVREYHLCSTMQSQNEIFRLIPSLSMHLAADCVRVSLSCRRRFWHFFLTITLNTPFFSTPKAFHCSSHTLGAISASFRYCRWQAALRNFLIAIHIDITLMDIAHYFHCCLQRQDDGHCAVIVAITILLMPAGCFPLSSLILYNYIKFHKRLCWNLRSLCSSDVVRL